MKTIYHAPNAPHIIVDFLGTVLSEATEWALTIYNINNEPVVSRTDTEKLIRRAKEHFSEEQLITINDYLHKHPTKIILPPATIWQIHSY